MRDLLPPATATWMRLSRVAAELAEERGYQLIVTPVLEHTEVFKHAVGAGTDIVEKEMYSFEDPGGRSLTLRPEATASAVRAYFDGALTQGPQPVRLWYEGPMFRHDKQQRGRYRSFFQFGVEAIGDSSPELDVEVIELASRWLRECGLEEFSLQVNSIGDGVCRPAYRTLLQDYYRPYLPQLCEDDRRRFDINPLRLFDCKVPSCQPFKADAPRIVDHLCEPCAEHHRTVLRTLDALEFTYTQNPDLVRGLDYYTRTAFEFWDPGVAGQQNALGGGGRYDGLAAVLGFPATPAVGFAMGEDRLVLALEDTGRTANPPPLHVAIIPVAEGSVVTAMQIATTLRDRELRVVVQHGRRSLKAHLRQAQKLGAPVVLILGEEEMAGGKVAIKNMDGGEQTVVARTDVVTAVADVLGPEVGVE